jgi:raffinose/stachyose/melibiose transport system substrate-binding protein
MVRSRNRKKVPRQLALLLAPALVLLAACGAPGGSATGTDAGSRGGIPAFPKGKVTLTLLDYQGSSNPQLGAAIQQLIKEFEAAHPNVTIKRNQTSFSDLLTKQTLIMNGPDAPDIADIAVNYTVESKYARNGLIIDLQKYANHYGWAKRYSPFLYGQSRFSTSGKLEQGDVYGLFFTEDVVGVFYNRAKLRQLGLTVPKTFQEFQADLVKAKKSGQQPIAFGNLDKYPAIHAFQQVQNSLASKTYLRDYSYRLKQPMTFNEPWNLQAAVEFQKWVKDGYFGPPGNVNATGFEDAKAKFMKGNGVFFIAGTWEGASIDKGMGSNAGFFLVPPAAGKPLTTLGGLGQTWTISGKCKYPQVAAAFLDFITSKKAAQSYLSHGANPGFSFTLPTKLSPLRSDELHAIDTANTSDALVGYLDGPTPSMYDTLTAALQNLIAGKATPGQFVQTVEKDYAQGKGS